MKYGAELAASMALRKERRDGVESGGQGSCIGMR
jgi:hypothetical protein